MIFTCTEFEGHWPIGTAAVVEAPNSYIAARRLNAALKEEQLRDDVKPSQMVEFDVPVRILCDGNY